VEEMGVCKGMHRFLHAHIPAPGHLILLHFQEKMRRLARRLIFGKWDARLGSETDAERMKIRKFKESAWKGVYFLSAEFLALAVTYNEPWFTSTMNFWVGPGDQIWPDQTMKFKLKGVYMYAAGFYMYSIIALLFWETRRSDFGLSMTHHIASVFLIVMSYIFR
uniref:TLC domain-containing protein n=1 Tax=Aegilops tauschii subsp. strangulata TaxID=200361 RepID=A0A453PGT4_AEGTS